MGLFNKIQMPFNLLNFLPSERELQIAKATRDAQAIEKFGSDPNPMRRVPFNMATSMGINPMLASSIPTAVDYTPVVGDISAGVDAKQAFDRGDLAMAGLLGGAAILPFVSSGAVKGVIKQAKGLLDRVDVSVDPATLGSMGGNIKVGLKPKGLLDDGGIDAYHGSGTIFDKFRMDKIGTGEGAQVYGQGLYFTDLEKIAKEYEGKLTPRDLDYEEWLMKKYNQAEKNQDYSRLEMYERALMHDKPSDFRSIANDADYDDDYRALADEIADEIEEYNPKFGATYKVKIKTKLEDMIDYDEPITDQPIKVQKAFRNIYKKYAYKDPFRSKPKNGWSEGKLTIDELRHMDLDNTSSGATAYKRISTVLNPNKFVVKANMTTDEIRKGIREEYNSGETMMSELLNSEGVTGIKYLDQNSRQSPYKIELFTKKGAYDTERIGARSKLDAEKLASDYEKRGFKTKITKEGTNNYVVFDEDLIEILAKYGIVGGVGIGAMKSGQENNQQPQGLLY